VHGEIPEIFEKKRFRHPNYVRPRSKKEVKNKFAKLSA